MVKVKRNCSTHGECEHNQIKPNVYICSLCYQEIIQNNLAKANEVKRIAWIKPYPYPHVKINNLEFIKAAFPIQSMPEGTKKVFYLEGSEKEKCHKCNGEGWVWWDELDNYSGPADKTGQDDTRYLCDACGEE